MKSEIVPFILVLIIYFTLLKKKSDVNEYFYYTYGHKIFMKMFIRKTSKNYSYYRNKRKLLEGWDKLPKNKVFKCDTHDIMKNYIERQEQKGNLTIIRCDICMRRLNLTRLEKKLGKKNNFSGKVTKYKIIFKT